MSHPVPDSAPDAAPDAMPDAAPDPATDADAAAEDLQRQLTTVDRLRRRSTALGEQARGWSDSVRARVPLVDTGWRIYERDRHAAGTLLGSAMALRLFLFFVPLLLLLVGIGGLLGQSNLVDSIAEDLQITGDLATDVDSVFEQPTLSPWIAITTGLFGVAWAGRSLTRALVLSSALSWQLGGRQRLPIRVVGMVVGLLVGFSLAWMIVNMIRDTAGLAIVTASFVAVAVTYLALWSLLYLTLPRATSDPGAALPGAAVVALTLSCLQAVTQLYLPRQVSSASSVYGFLGGVLAILGWFFIIGRALAFSFAINAVVFEVHGSLSRFVFSLPVLRILPRRWPAFAAYFDLPSETATDATPEDRSAEPPGAPAER